MEDLEAFMLDALYSVSLDVVLQEFKVGSVCLDWVAQIIFIDVFFVISQEPTDRLDARC